MARRDTLAYLNNGDRDRPCLRAAERGRHRVYQLPGGSGLCVHFRTRRKIAGRFTTADDPWRGEEGKSDWRQLLLAKVIVADHKRPRLSSAMKLVRRSHPALGYIGRDATWRVALASVYGCISTQVPLPNDTAFARGLLFVGAATLGALVGRRLDRRSVENRDRSVHRVGSRRCTQACARGRAFQTSPRR